MKIERVDRQEANYPLKKMINPIILSMSIAVTFNGCLANKPKSAEFKPISRENSGIRPFKPISIKENNHKNNIELEEEATGGVPLPPPNYNR